MSAGYGRVRLTFLKKDDSKDVEMAKKVFDFCCSEYDWFCGSEDEDSNDCGDFFECKDGDIYTAGDGLDIKHSIAEEVLDGEWLVKLCTECKPVQMTAEIVEDFSESDYDSNTYHRYIFSSIFNGRRVLEVENFNFNSGGQIEGFYLKEGSSPRTLIDDVNYKDLYPKFRNKKTGKEIVFTDTDLEMNARSENDDCDDLVSDIENGEFYLAFGTAKCYTAEGKIARHPNEVKKVVFEDDEFSVALEDQDLEDEEDQNSENWEFCGFEYEFEDD